MKQWMLGLMLLLAFPAGLAAGEPEVAESLLTMRVDGEILVGPAGNVAEYTIATEVPGQIRQVLDKAVRGWTFQPVTVDGQPAAIRNTMRVTLAAREAGTDYVVTVDNVTFRPVAGAGSGDAPAIDDVGVVVSGKSMKPGGYPSGLSRAGVEGAVLLCARLSPEGDVVDVTVVQSSLFNVRGRPDFLEKARALFERQALVAAKRWKFDVDIPAGVEPTASDLTVNVPYWYVSEGSSALHSAGGWRIEVRGARRKVAWLSEEEYAQAFGVSDLDRGDIASLASLLRVPEGVVGKSL